MIGRPKALINNDTEAALLACALADPQHFVLLDVQPRDFHNELYGQAWSVGKEQVDQNDFADVVSVVDALEQRGVDVGIALDRVQTLEVNVFDAPIHAKKVKDLARRRRADTRLQAALRATYNSNGTWQADVEVALDGLRQDLAQPITQQIQKRVTSYTAAELLAAQFPDPPWAVPGLIPVGFTLLAGRPKVGKSWFALQTAIAVGTGGMVLGKRVKQGKALYLALEDNGRRLQERTKRQGMPTTATIDFVIAWPRFKDGGLQALDQAITENKYVLVIIDTLGRAAGRVRTDDYGDMTDLLGSLQEIAMAHDTAILALDHHRKSAPGVQSDPVDDIVGSTAKSGAADAVLGLSKEQGKRGATLQVTGRDIEWQDLALSWDAVTCCWQYEGTTEEVQQQGNKSKVLDALRDSGEPMTQTDLAPATGIDRRNLSQLLSALVDDGLIERLPKQGREVPYRIREGA